MLEYIIIKIVMMQKVKVGNQENHVANPVVPYIDIVNFLPKTDGKNQKYLRILKIISFVVEEKQKEKRKNKLKDLRKNKLKDEKPIQEKRKRNLKNAENKPLIQTSI